MGNNKIRKCSGCEKKMDGTCKEICREIEDHLTNDIEVNRKEEWLSEMEEDQLENNRKWPQTLTSPEQIIRMFFLEHKTSREIQKILNISQQYVSQVVCKYRIIIKKNIGK
jgi:DNA-directed RNA polymerase specialized sigma subunit